MAQTILTVPLLFNVLLQTYTIGSFTDYYSGPLC